MVMILRQPSPGDLKSAQTQMMEETSESSRLLRSVLLLLSTMAATISCLLRVILNGDVSAARTSKKMEALIIQMDGMSIKLDRRESIKETSMHLLVTT